MKELNRRELYNQYSESKATLIEEIKKFCKDIIKEYNKKHNTKYEYAPPEYELNNLKGGFIVKARYKGQAIPDDLVKVSFLDFLENRITDLINI